MADEISCGTPTGVPEKKEPQPPRARSVSHRRCYVRTVALSTAHYLGIIACLTSLTIFFVNPSPLATRVFALSVAFTGVSWLIAFFNRRHTYCPLCKGTPLINSGALTHRRAVRWYPLNQGVTATLSIIATQKFRCMYCGTLFDLLKIPSHKQNYELDVSRINSTSYEAYTADDSKDS